MNGSISTKEACLLTLWVSTTKNFFWKKEILILYNLFQKIEKQEILTYSLKQQSWF